MEDEKIKKVSNVISNESCRKILDYLSEKDATESELAGKLDIPISTVHYNLQQLIETGLIESTEFHYSEKGKEVSHYRLANKYIIIAPKKTFGIKEKLKAILPVALIVSGAALVVQLVKKFFAHGAVTNVMSTSQQMIVRETIIGQEAADQGAAVAAAKVAEGVQNITQAAPGIMNKTTEYLTQPEIVTKTTTIPPSMWSNIALWFLIGALFALLVYLIIVLIRKEP
jgi:predicted ArsR family transcriptional regulator